VRTIKLTLEYDGAGLCGWQRQANGPTVQQHVEEAVAAMVGQRVEVAGASRTDAGVHALGQVASFTTDRSISLYGFRRGINSKLPSTIAVVDAAEAPAGFHARFWSRGKRYRYTVLTRRDRSPMLEGRAWHHPGSLDLAAMRAAAAHLVGEHDFSAFRAAGCTALHPVRAITSVVVGEHPGEVVQIEVDGNAFLRNMVRILAGTLVEVGAGRRTPAEVAAALASRERSQAGITAPPGGLCLVEVRHGDGPARRATDIA
jgi:tRNA pseudouridine38-40 synthase